MNHIEIIVSNRNSSQIQNFIKSLQNVKQIRPDKKFIDDTKTRTENIEAKEAGSGSCSAFLLPKPQIWIRSAAQFHALWPI